MADSEKLSTPENDNEQASRYEGLKNIAAEYLDADDAAFLDELDDEDERISYVYGRLLEQGEDPDEVLQQNGVIENEEQ